MPQQGPELRDIHVPQVSWWPLAPGWWLLAALVLVAIVLFAWRWRRRMHRRRAIGRVLAGLHAARARHATDGDDAAFAASAHQLIRRVARTRDAASVTYTAGAWREALASMAPKRDISLLATLGDAMYRPGPKLDADAIASDVEAWVREVLGHRGRRGKGSAHVPS
jgi:hypothetical protein